MILDISIYMTSTVHYSTSLIHYLLKEPGIYSYIKPDKNAVISTDKVFTYSYLNRNEYNALIEKRFLGNRSTEGFTLPHNRPEKQVVPPKWSRGDVAKLQKLFDDPNVSLIAFPLLLFGKFTSRIDPRVNIPTEADAYIISKTKKYKPTNEGEHSIVLLYNKQTKDVEILDYDYGNVKTYFNYEHFVDKDLLFFMKPILETFGADVHKVILPQIHHPRFGDLKHMLATASLPNDFSVMYKVFLASYIHMRTEEMMVQGTDLAKKVIPHKTAPNSSIEFMIQQYMTMSTEMGENPLVSSWIPSKEKEASLPFEFTKPCPENYVRDFQTGECVPAEKDILERLKIVEQYSKGKHFYPDRSSKWLTLILRYWTDKYKHLAVMIPKHTYNPHPYYYAIQYNYTPRKQSAKTHMNFSIPPDFYDFIDFSMNDPTKRFISILVGIDFKGLHANPVIIDKVERTVERIEVNTPHMDFSYGYNDKTLDEQLQTLFEKDPRLESYRLKYIHAMEACPFGLHRAEYIEPTFDVPDVGGRCAEWSLFYIELRAANPSIEREKLYSYALEQIRKTGSIKHFIYGYMEYTVHQARKYKLKDYNRTLHPLLSIPKKERMARISSVPKGTITVVNEVLPPIPKIKAKSAPEIIIPTLDLFIKKQKLKKRPATL